MKPKILWMSNIVKSVISEDHSALLATTVGGSSVVTNACINIINTYEL